MIYFGGKNYNEIRSYFGSSSKVELDQEFYPNPYQKYYFSDNAFFQITDWYPGGNGGIAGIPDKFEYKISVNGKEYYDYWGFPVEILRDNEPYKLYSYRTGNRLTWVKIIKN